MSPEEFDGLYGKMIRGEESATDAITRAREQSASGSKVGTNAATYAKKQRSRSVASPVASQADMAPPAPPGAAAVPPQPPATPKPYENYGPEAPEEERQPLYSMAKEYDIPGKVSRAATEAGKYMISGGMLPAARAMVGSIPEVAKEAAFQAQPMLDDFKNKIGSYEQTPSFKSYQDLVRKKLFGEEDPNGGSRP